jgi:uncharacterized protein (TIGR02266 family)
VATAQDGRAVGFWVDFTPGEETLQRLVTLFERVLAEGAPTPAAVERLATPAQGQARAAPALTPPEIRVPAGFEPDPQRQQAERRRAPRVRLRAPLAVRFSSEKEFVLEHAADLSAGGVFIRTDSPPAVGTEVRVRLELPDGGAPLEADGVVVHRVDAGAGVRFVNTDTAFELRVESFLDWVRKQKR